MGDVLPGRRAALQLRLQLAQRRVYLVFGGCACGGGVRPVRCVYAAARQGLELDLQLQLTVWFILVIISVCKIKYTRKIV